MLEKFKSGSRAIVPAQKAVGRAIQVARKNGVTIGLTIAGGAALWLGFQQFMLQQQAANFQNRIDTIQKNMEQTAPKNLPDKDRLTLQKDLATLEKERITAENAIRSSLIQGLGGLFIIATAYIAWRNLLLAQEKQTAERFSKAVEQLGSEKVHVRLGGIYALEQIAKDAEEKYYWPAIETLTAFVREESPFPPKTKSKATESQTDVTMDMERPSLKTDIQAVLTVISRRKHSYLRGEPHPLNLGRTNLQGLQFLPNTELAGTNFIAANLQGAQLVGANLQEAQLTKAELQEADLTGVKLQMADLTSANLQQAKLWAANLQQADLTGANLQQARLDGASLQSAQLAGANLQQANLWNAKLQGATLVKTDLQQAMLVNANLKEANLWNAKLQEARLVEANLQGAALWDVNLQGANLIDADLRGAKLRKNFAAGDVIGLTWQQLEKAKYIREELPDYLLQNPSPASVD